MKTLNNSLYNYYDEQICYLNRQLELFELCDLETEMLSKKIDDYTKARNRTMTGIFIDNNLLKTKNKL